MFLFRNRDELGKGSRIVHTDEFAVRAEVAASAPAILAGSASNQRIQHHLLPRLLSGNDNPGGFVPQNQRWHSTGILAVVGVHV